MTMMRCLPTFNVEPFTADEILRWLAAVPSIGMNARHGWACFVYRCSHYPTSSLNFIGKVSGRGFIGSSFKSSDLVCRSGEKGDFSGWIAPAMWLARITQARVNQAPLAAAGCVLEEHEGVIPAMASGLNITERESPGGISRNLGPARRTSQFGPVFGAKIPDRSQRASAAERQQANKGPHRRISFYW
jgi:hypothetical protein